MVTQFYIFSLSNRQTSNLKKHQLVVGNKAGHRPVENIECLVTLDYFQVLLLNQ